MKKLILTIACILISLSGLMGFSACGNGGTGEEVYLVPIEGNGVGLMKDIDYYVVPEPVASTKVKIIENLNFSGDLQKLYGGEKGYPQAVVVAKNNLLGTETLKKFVNELYGSREWLLSENTQTETIVNSISSNLTDGLEPTIKKSNLSKDVIKNCGIEFVSATDSKNEILTFMEKFNSVSQTSFGVPQDLFFNNGDDGDAQYSKQVSVYAPDGAPALGIAKLMSENKIENVKYEIVNANVIQTLVAGASPEADICVLPVNVAVKILSDAKNYKLIGTLTHGNLFILSENKTYLTAENLSLLKGKRVGVVNLPSVPGLTFKLILKNNGLNYIEN